MGEPACADVPRNREVMVQMPIRAVHGPRSPRVHGAPPSPLIYTPDPITGAAVGCTVGAARLPKNIGAPRYWKSLRLNDPAQRVIQIQAQISRQGAITRAADPCQGVVHIFGIQSR